MSSKRFGQFDYQQPASTPFIREHTPQLERISSIEPSRSESELEKTRSTSKTDHILASLERWWPELLSCAFAIAIFLVLTVGLRLYQGKVLSSWPLGITINTFVAICTLLIKVSLAMIVSNGIGQLKWVWYSKARPLGDLQQYDSASRGVVGSLGLLWTHRNGRRMIPVLGAILTIFLTLVDPFGQALVRFENCTIMDPSIRSRIATAHHANLVDPNNPYVLNGNVMTPMMIGMLNDSLIPPVSFDCPTGNCTYPNPYHSSGYCSKCSDVSDQVKAASNFTWYWDAANFTLASNRGAQYMGYTAAVMEMAVSSPPRTNSSPPKANSIASIQIMGSQLKECVDNSTTPWRCREYGAAVCEISTCVISYTGEVDVGALKETVKDTSEAWSSGDERDNNLMGSIDVSCLNTSERNALQHAGFDISPDTNWLAYNVSFYDKNMSYLVVNESVVRPECLYATDRRQIGIINSLFRTTYVNTQIAEISSKAGDYIDGELQWQAIWNRGILDFADVERAFGGLAKGMTNFARNNPRASTQGELGDDFWNGTSYRNTTCIQIQWQWITYPAIALFGAIVFLIGTMVMTRTTLEVNGQDYKTSILPLMFHGIAFSDPEASFKTPTFTNDMIAAAENIYVQFGPAERGWQFVEKRVT